MTLALVTCDSRLFSHNLFLLNPTKNNDLMIQEQKEGDSTNKLDKHLPEDDVSLFGELEAELIKSKFNNICLILKNPVYTFTCIGITTLLFISTAVIFWASDYCTNVLGQDPQLVLITFVVICLTGPVLGIILGGVIVQKFAGGYEGKHAGLFCVIFALFAILCAFPVKWVTGIYLFGVLLWAILFFGGAIIPNAQGIMISSLDNELRASGNSISNIFQNAIGFLPAPSVYGLIYNNTKHSDPSLAMSIVLMYSLVGLVFLVISLIFRYKNWNVISKRMLEAKKLEEEKEKKQEELNSQNSPEVKEVIFEESPQIRRLTSVSEYVNNIRLALA